MLKLQIIETNEKDLLDEASLLFDHPITSDETGINSSYIAMLCTKDRGLSQSGSIVISPSSDSAILSNTLPEQREDIERLAQYIIRNPFSLDKMQFTERILRHLGLWEQGVRVFPTRAPPEPDQWVIEPCYDDPFPCLPRRSEAKTGLRHRTG